MTNAQVVIQPLSSYEPDAVAKALEDLLAPLGGLGAFVKPDESVVLKPNLLAPRPAETAVTTHPEIIRQVARLAHGCGVKPVVTDSPGVGSAKACAKKIGLVDTEYLTVENAKEAVIVPAPSHGLQKLHMSKRMRDADKIINIPKAKTHGQMLVTAAVKNMFGAVVGLEKAQWHFRIGRDPRHFARLVVHIHEMTAPALHILDGVIGMEGNGPGSGTPRNLGFLMAGTNAHAMDYALCRIWGIDPMKVYTIAAAKELGLLPDWENIQIHGDLDAATVSPRWKMASPVSVARLAGPTWMVPFWEKLLETKPLVQHDQCTMCMECHRQCAAKAIDVSNGQIDIDKSACISCFCCQEMCPHGAIEVHTGPLARLLGLGRH